VLLSTLLFSACSDNPDNNKDFSGMVAFDLADVRLGESPFKHAMDMDGKWLLSLDPDRLLSGFRLESGLAPKAEKYGDWESGGVCGHTFGHYLSAMSMLYASTGNEEILERINYSINELDSCQQVFGGGLVAGFPRARGLFNEISQGDIRTEGFDLNGGWVPLYTLHKLFAGLIDVYRLTGNQQAYKVLTALSEGIYNVFNNLTDDQIQQILICEHGGINESMAEVSDLTRDGKFLTLAGRLNHKAVLDPLAQGRDELAGKHANTQIPKVIGVIRQYELNGDSTLYNVGDFFWNTVVHNHSYVIGGNSEAEHFGVPNCTYDRITDRTCENCNTYNMLKLTKHLYQLDPAIEKVDYYERALYNQILSSQNPKDGMVCYMSPLAAGSKRTFSTPFNSFWCCVGTGLENHTRYGEFIYFTDNNDNLYVNLFIPSRLNWRKRDIVFSQETSFPLSDTVRYTVKINDSKDQKFILNLRYPEWAKKGFTLAINGEKQDIKQAPGNYIHINRIWSDNDVIEYILPKSITSEAALGNKDVRAYLYGPIVLSAVFDEPDPSVYPAVVIDHFEDVSSIIESTGDPLFFNLKAARPYTVKMKPYYQTGDSRVMVYFDHYTKNDWAEYGEDNISNRNDEMMMKKRTVSSFQPGEMQPERDHNFKGENLELGEISGRKYRKAVDGGWFSFDMDVVPDRKMNMVATYWGHFGDIYKFVIEIDDVPVSTAIIHWWGQKFIDKTYYIPQELTKGKNKVTVKFRAIEDVCVAGPLFGCKMIKQ